MLHFHVQLQFDSELHQVMQRFIMATSSKRDKYTGNFIKITSPQENHRNTKTSQGCRNSEHTRTKKDHHQNEDRNLG